MIERTEITVELDSKDIGQALREYVARKGIEVPTYARVEITAGEEVFPLTTTGKGCQPINATLTIRNGSKPVEETT